jgi:hypothetical protein
MSVGMSAACTIDMVIGNSLTSIDAFAVDPKKHEIRDVVNTLVGNLKVRNN